MSVGSGLYMYDVVVKRSRSLSHLLMSSCMFTVTSALYYFQNADAIATSVADCIYEGRSKRFAIWHDNVK